MLAGPHPNCHSTVALHQAADRRGTSGPGGRGHQREASRTRSRDNNGKGGGERGERPGALWAGAAPGQPGDGVLDGSHHVTANTTDRRLHDN